MPAGIATAAKVDDAGSGTGDDAVDANAVLLGGKVSATGAGASGRTAFEESAVAESPAANDSTAAAGCQLPSAASSDGEKGGSCGAVGVPAAKDGGKGGRGSLVANS